MSVFFCFVCYFQAESCGLELGATSKSVGSSMAQLLTAASQVSFVTNNELN